jgi:hypothetical protein
VHPFEDGLNRGAAWSVADGASADRNQRKKVRNDAQGICSIVKPIP